MDETKPGRIYLMRHAQAGWALPGQQDFERSLDNRGLGEARDMAEAVVARGYRPDRAICSTARRCRQTADALIGAFGDLSVDYTDALYNAPADTYLDVVEIETTAASLLFVGHNPAMEELLERLAGSQTVHRAVPDGYPTAGFAVLDRVDRASTGSAHGWRLVDFIGPADL